MGSGPVPWCIRRHSSMNCAYNLGTLSTFQGSNQAKILKFEVKHQTSVEIPRYIFSCLRYVWKTVFHTLCRIDITRTKGPKHLLETVSSYKMKPMIYSMMVRWNMTAKSGIWNSISNEWTFSVWKLAVFFAFLSNIFKL